MLFYPNVFWSFFLVFVVRIFISKLFLYLQILIETDSLSLFLSLFVYHSHIHAFNSLCSVKIILFNLKIKIYKTIILSVVLYGYGYETWSLTLREESRLRVFKTGSEANIWAQEG